MDKGLELLSSITVWSKYAKYIPELQRRENWSEITHRYLSMMEEKYPMLKNDIYKYGQLILDKQILPSMRMLQFAGKAIGINHARSYNCSYLPIDDYRAFGEVMFLLLGGTGVGYSVQKNHVDKLPEIRSPKGRRKYVISDDIQGWANSIKILMKSYYGMCSKPVFDYSDIRLKGARLVTAGGKAPGPDPLKLCHFQIETILDRKKDGEKLTSLECHDILCYIANSVLAGGIRRSAMIAGFDIDDQEMLTCKFGNWWELNEQRGRANNSAVLKRSKLKKDDFEVLWKKIETSGSGEPGFYLSNNTDWFTNPCCFTGDTIVATADGRNGVTIKQLAEESQWINSFPVYSGKSSTYPRQKKEGGSFRKWKSEIQNAIAFKTGTKKIITVNLSNGSSLKCTPDHLLALPDGSYVEAKDSLGLQLESFFTFLNKGNNSYRTINSKTNGFARQYRMIYEFGNPNYVSKEKHIDHVNDISTDDRIENLMSLDISDHKTKTKRNGGDNPIHKANKEFVRLNSKRSNIYANSIRYNWDEKRTNAALDEFDNAYGKRWSELKNKNANIDLSGDVFVESIVDNNEIEDVYDLNVENNHNFYILTKTDDDNYLNSSGVLVHNCEIALRPFQMCNLCEINFSSVESQRDFEQRVEAASFFGTLQAGFTDFYYLRDVWKKTCEKDALLGIGITGLASSKINEIDFEQAIKQVAIPTNKKIASVIGINSSARISCVKPSGTTSCVLGTSSGIHDWHSKYYIRTVRFSKDEAISNYLKQVNPSMVEDDILRPHDTVCIRIPIKAPNGAIVREDVSEIDLLERVKLVSEKWVKPGHIKGDNTHNVSATISIKEDKWYEVGEWMWKNKKYYNGLSVLPYWGGTYQQAPFEEITEQYYNELVSNLKNIDLDYVLESEDITDLKGEVACSGSSCEIV